MDRPHPRIMLVLASLPALAILTLTVLSYIARGSLPWPDWPTRGLTAIGVGFGCIVTLKLLTRYSDTPAAGRADAATRGQPATF